MRTPLAWYRARAELALTARERQQFAGLQRRLDARAAAAAPTPQQLADWAGARTRLSLEKWLARGRPGCYATRYCTKHVLVQPIPGGPERLTWVYGPHRTAGNACDGSEHRRKGPLSNLADWL